MPKQTYINSTTILFWFTRAKAEGYYTFNIISPYCSVFVFVAVKNVYSCNFVYIMAKPKTQFIQWGTNGYQKSNAMNKFVICMIYIPFLKRLHTFVHCLYDLWHETMRFVWYKILDLRCFRLNVGYRKCLFNPIQENGLWNISFLVIYMCCIQVCVIGNMPDCKEIMLISKYFNCTPNHTI